MNDTTLTPVTAATHNGKFTATNKETGTWRTFQIRTQPNDAKFMPGVRLVALLAGSDNTADYLSFGLVGDDGKIILWKKHRGSKFYEWATRFLENPAAYADKVDLLVEGKCRKCNRTLTTPESINSGIGPVCANKGY